MLESRACRAQLVIFLRSTHAELVEAGYEGLDPKDMIFKEYRPES